MDRSHPVILALLAGACSGSAGQPGAEPLAQLASEVISAPGATGEGFGQTALAVNGVRGGGDRAGSLDVYSISNEPWDELVLAFDQPVPDGDGDDLVVFENPFDIEGGGRFMDPAVVSVSADGERFFAFPCAYGLETYSSDPDRWRGFAGVTPVALHEEDYPVDPLSPEAGGDGFDLASLLPAPDGTPAPEEISFVRVISASLLRDEATGQPFPRDPASNGPDIDGIYGRIP